MIIFTYTIIIIFTYFIIINLGEYAYSPKLCMHLNLETILAL